MNKVALESIPKSGKRVVESIAQFYEVASIDDLHFTVQKSFLAGEQIPAPDCAWGPFESSEAATTFAQGHPSQFDPQWDGGPTTDRYTAVSLAQHILSREQQGKDWSDLINDEIEWQQGDQNGFQYALSVMKGFDKDAAITCCQNIVDHLAGEAVSASETDWAKDWLQTERFPEDRAEVMKKDVPLRFAMEQMPETQQTRMAVCTLDFAELEVIGDSREFRTCSNFSSETELAETVLKQMETGDNWKWHLQDYLSDNHGNCRGFHTALAAIVDLHQNHSEEEKIALGIKGETDFSTVKQVCEETLETYQSMKEVRGQVDFKSNAFTQEGLAKAFLEAGSDSKLDAGGDQFGSTMGFYRALQALPTETALEVCKDVCHAFELPVQSKNQEAAEVVQQATHEPRKEVEIEHENEME